MGQMSSLCEVSRVKCQNQQNLLSGSNLPDENWVIKKKDLISGFHRAEALLDIFTKGEGGF